MRMHTRRFKRLALSTLLLFGSTTSFGSDGPRLLEERLAETPELVEVPRKDLEFLIQFGRQCNSAVMMCNQHLQKLDQALKETDRVLDDQAKLIGELEAERGSKNWWTPLLIGLVAGTTGALILK